MSDVDALLRDLKTISARVDALTPVDRDSLLQRLRHRQKPKESALDASIDYQRQAPRLCPTCGSPLPDSPLKLEDILLADSSAKPRKF